MAVLRIFTIICASWILVESKLYNHYKREVTSSLCDSFTNSTNKVLCFCGRNSLKPEQIKSAECYLTTEDVKPNDSIWNGFDVLKHATKLTLINNRGVPLKYIPTKAIGHAKSLAKLIIKYGNIEKIEAFAFSNLTHLDEIIARDNNIKILEKNAFAHHKNVSIISMDTNDIEEINRDVFVDLPSIQKIFLTGNKITTIHDRAFIHLGNLRELEIDKNKLFSLNSETFSGLHNLMRLDLSSNSLEVIGDNTFIHLVSLRSLNLDGNQIQMLDEKAFNGLGKLNSLSLAHNKISDIENVKIFEGLDNLKTLSLKENQIREIRADVMAPIIHNFYGTTSFLDFDGNKFPCECRLDWFLSLRKKTQNEILKNSLVNIKCYPSDALRDSWNKDLEKENKEAKIFEDEETQAQNSDYEYYDESQLNGTLFYTDVRYLLNCTGPDYSININLPTNENTATTTKATSSLKPIFTTVTISTIKPISTTKFQATKVYQDLLDLSVVESTTLSVASRVFTERSKNSNDVIITNEQIKKKESPTTSRLATVSANPIDNKHYDDHDMASDEAKPDKLKAHRSYQENIDAPKTNIAQRDIGYLWCFISIVFSIELFLL